MITNAKSSGEEQTNACDALFKFRRIRRHREERRSDFAWRSIVSFKRNVMIIVAVLTASTTAGLAHPHGPYHSHRDDAVGAAESSGPPRTIGVRPGPWEGNYQRLPE